MAVMSILKKATKSLSKAAKNVTKSVSKAMSDVTKATVKAHVDGAKLLQLDKAAQYGAPVAATFIGGPVAGAAVSSAQGGSQMSLVKGLGDYFGLDPSLTNIADSYLTGLASNKPKPVKVETAAPPVQLGQVESQPDYLKWGLIGGAGLLGVLAIVLIARK